MPHFGFVRVVAAVPRLILADPAENARRSLDILRRAESNGAAIVVFPELGLTGYTCHDLFHQSTLLLAALAALESLAADSADVFRGLAIVGLPVIADDRVFNCAAVISRGQVLGIIPKTYLPNYKEFYDARYFAPASQARSDYVSLPSAGEIPFGADLLFEAVGERGLVIGVEICEDLWVPNPPSSRQALAGATILCNLSASDELVGKASYRRQLVEQQSARCIAAYVYSGAGVGESSTDLVFGGHALIAENGHLLDESERFRRDDVILTSDVDVERLQNDRWRTTSFGEAAEDAGGLPWRRVPFEIDLPTPSQLRRPNDAHPFVPNADAELHERCREVFAIQTAGLARRLEQIGKPPVVIGVSGGLDSTLALVVACKTMDLIGAPRSNVLGITMPGFGTTARTKTNALALMKQLGLASREIDIRPMCLAEWIALGHKPFGIELKGLDVDGLMAKLRDVPTEKRHDLVFENVQARVRTNLLMNSGFTIGTGDLSELALGWCTYNADHMSMYNVNVSVPKTLVKFLVNWVADHEFDGEARQTLHDVVGTEISPELLPAAANGAAQSTESVIGPYELHDFFLFHLLRYGASPAKVLFLAGHAKFDREYSKADVKKWLSLFVKRFFANQFKRSCLPDGPKVGSLTLSPRGDWRMPSDASAAAWLADLES